MKKYFIKDTARELKFGEEIDAFKSIEQNGKTRLYHFDCKFVDDPELIAKLLEAELIEEVESDEEPEEDDEPVYDFNTEELVAMLMDENDMQNKDIAELKNRMAVLEASMASILNTKKDGKAKGK